MSYFPNPITAAGSTTARTLVARFGEVYNVRDYGATGDGATDDSAAIQAAVNAAAAANASRSDMKFKGATIWLPRGQYVLSNTVNLTTTDCAGLHIRGDGIGSTVIILNNAAANGLVIGNTTDQIRNVSVSDITIYSGPQMLSSYSAIKLINGYNTHFSNLHFSENPSFPAPLSGDAFNSSFTRIYTCLDLQSGAVNQYCFQTYIENVNINNGQYGIRIGDSGGVVQDTYISKSIIAQCVDTGVLLRYASGTYFSEGSNLYCRTGVATYPSAGQTVNWTFFSGWISDTNVEDGYKFITDGGTVKSIQMVNSWASSNGKWQNNNYSNVTYPSSGRGIWISQGAGTVTGLNITNFTALANRREGLVAEGASKISIMNPNLCGNSASSSGSLDGIYMFNTSEWSISGGMSGNTITGITNTQRYGVNIGGTSDTYQVIGMNLVGNVTGGVNDGGGATKYLAGNLS